MSTLSQLHTLLLAGSTGILAQALAQGPGVPSIPVEVPRRGTPGIPERILQIDALLKALDSNHQGAGTPAPPRETPLRGMPGVPSRAGVSTHPIVREIPVRRSPGAPDAGAFYPYPVRFPWQTDYIIPGGQGAVARAGTPERTEPEAAETGHPEATRPTAPASPAAPDTAVYELYLHQTPLSAEQAARQAQQLQQLYDLSAAAPDGKDDVIARVRQGLAAMSDCPAVGDMGLTLSSMMRHVQDMLQENTRRQQANAGIEQDMERLRAENNRLLNQSTPKKGDRNTYTVAYQTHKINKLADKQRQNHNASIVALGQAREGYQHLLEELLRYRYYDLAAIGAQCYRHLFAELPGADINAIVPRIVQKRQETDTAIARVELLMASKELKTATEVLTRAAGEGRHILTVCQFPAEHRLQLDEYRKLISRCRNAMKAKDFSTAEQLLTRLAQISSEDDTSTDLAVCARQKAMSNHEVDKALRARQKGDDAACAEALQRAADIWPQNPGIPEGLMIHH